MLSMRYGDKLVPDFEPLVKLLPPDAVASPLRSTVPLVDFCRRPEEGSQSQCRSDCGFFS
jgi:hypothetical protein